MNPYILSNQNIDGVGGQSCEQLVINRMMAVGTHGTKEALY